jgi:hypothetical protein
MTQAKEAPWRVPVRIEDVPENGTHVELIADDKTRAAIAAVTELRTLPRLAATFDVARRGSGLRVVGEVRATVGQTCVVTLEPIENEIHELIDLVFAPSPVDQPEPQAETEFSAKSAEPPEALIDGIVDLGAVATEFLILGIDPYPRKPGAVFESARIGEDATHPFAALAKLKQKKPGADT